MSEKEENNETCPTCFKKYKYSCKCSIGDMVCENNHHWYINAYGEKITGTGHGPQKREREVEEEKVEEEKEEEEMKDDTKLIIFRSNNIPIDKTKCVRFAVSGSEKSLDSIHHCAVVSEFEYYEIEKSGKMLLATGYKKRKIKK